MATTINSNTTDGLVITPDTSGEIKLQSAGTDIVSVTVNGMAVDTNTLYVDATNNRVGIGTSSPAQSLDVQTASGNYQLRLGNTANAAYTYDIGRNTSDGYLYFYGAQSGSNGFVFSGSNGERMRITNSGWLGIGITSPARMLDVLSGARFQGSQSVGTMLTSTGALGGVEVTGGGGANAAFMSFHRPGVYASYFGIDTDNYFAVGGWSAGAGLNAFKCGALSKTSGSFKIDHPLPELNETHNLVHSFVESPQANNIYRGKVELVNGQATVNLDTVSTMTEGTFVALNRDIHCYTSNETDWDAVKGSVNGNILTIQCQNENSTATVSWLVIGERQDKHMYDTDWTDENGKVIVEPLKTKSAITSQVPMDEEMENA